MFKISDEGNECVFTTNLFAFLPRGEKRLLTSNELGLAFEPEQRFENPDGSTIVFDTDILGDHRNIRPTAGPFEKPSERYVIFRTGSFRQPVLIEGVRPALTKESIIDPPVSRNQDQNNSKDTSREDIAKEKKISSKNTPLLEDSFEEIMSKDDSQAQDVEGDSFESDDSSSRDRKKNLHCQIALVDCDNISVTCKEQVRQVAEIFIEDNIAWVHLEGDSGITEIDCAYGICHYIPSWSMEAEDTVSVKRSDGTMALGRCIAALLRIYIDKDLQDPDIMEERVSAQEGPVLSHYGIQLRFAKRQLKLVRNKKFLTLLQAAEAVRRASGDVIVEEIDG
jgi:hypothetical protein